MSHLLCCCFPDFLFIFGFQQIDSNVSQGESLWVYPACSSLGFFSYRFMSFLKFWIFSVIISSVLVLSLLSFGTSIMHMLVCLRVSHRSLRTIHFFHSVFYFCSSDSTISIDLSPTANFFSPCSNQLLKPYKLFVSVTVYSSSGTLFVSVHNFYVFVNILYCSYISILVLFHLWLWFILGLWAYLRQLI